MRNPTSRKLVITIEYDTKEQVRTLLRTLSYNNLQSTEHKLGNATLTAVMTRTPIRIEEINGKMYEIYKTKF